jgi:lysyl-tRNA synthetase class 1
MFWADRITEKIIESYPKKTTSPIPLVIRDEKTASGRVHVGSMRGVAIHGIVSELLFKHDIENKFLFEINDFDPMDGLPVYLSRETFEPFLGKLLYTVPSPDGKAKNYAEYFGQEFMSVIEETGFHPEYCRTSELYLSGKMNEVIREALEQAPLIRKIYKEISGSLKDPDWLPVNVICEQCGKVSTTSASSFNGKTVNYVCKDLDWTKGCGKEGVVSPFDGHAKLPWKVEWPAKWKVIGVSIEGAGKDHSTRGGSRDVAKHIAKEVFNFNPPFDIPYEFFLVGGKKMSSSKGEGSSAREIADLLPPSIFRLALLGKDINQAINFDPSGDTVPVLFDTYDRLAENYWSGVKDDNARLFELSHTKETHGKLINRFLPRFSQIAFLVQMKHLNLEEEVSRMKGEPLSKDDVKEFMERADYAKRWLKKYAPEDYRYELQETLPSTIANFSDIQKKALREILEYVEREKNLDGQETHTKLHEIRKALSIDPKDFFGAIYLSFLGKESGPKAGWFLSVLDRNFLKSRLAEVSK